MAAATPTETPNPASAAPKGRKKLLVIAALATTVAAAGGGGAWWFLGQRPAPAATPAPPARTHFTSLEPFTVNLQDPQGDRFAQIGVTLELDEPAAETRIRDRLPAVRNNILMLISAKQAEELVTPEGKRQLATEVREQVALALPGAPNPVRHVLFSQFIVQ